MRVYYNAKHQKAMFVWNPVNIHDLDIRRETAEELFSTIQAIRFLTTNQDNVSPVGTHIKYRSNPDDGGTISATLDTKESGYDDIFRTLFHIENGIAKDEDLMLTEEQLSKIREFGNTGK